MDKRVDTKLSLMIVLLLKNLFISKKKLLDLDFKKLSVLDRNQLTVNGSLEKKIKKKRN